MSEPVRVLNVDWSMTFGGGESFIMNVYRNIDRSKVQFDFILHSKNIGYYDDEIRKLGGKIYYIDEYKLFNHLSYVNQWKNFFKEHKEFKIIHGHMTGTASIYLNIAKKFGLKTIAHSHLTSSNGIITGKIKDMMRKNIRYVSDYMFACSMEAGIFLFGKENIGKFKVIKNAINSQDYIFDSIKRNEYRDSFHLNDKFTIGHVARFLPVKNYEFILNLFNHIHKINNNTILMLVGDGQLRNYIEKRIKDLNLEDSVVLTGARSDINYLLSAMDLFLFPSLSEGLPFSLIEAQASGLHCVISDVISDEVIITDLVEKLSLNTSIEAWSNKILNYSNGYIRENKQDSIIKAEFDIKKTAQWLQEFYLNEDNN